jgi:diguanylate cyclase (GGDEF)-like protein
MPGRRYWPLWVRIVFFSVLAVLLLQLAGFGLIRSTTEHVARRALAAELEVGARVWAELQRQRAERLRQGAAVLASDFGFRDALSSGDRATAESALANHGRRLGAEAVVAFDTRFDAQAWVLSEGRGGVASPEWLGSLKQAAPALARGEDVVRVLKGRPYQVVMVPIRAPQTLGWVAMGFPIDAAMLGQLRDITGLQAALWLQGPPGARLLAHTAEAPVMTAATPTAGAGTWLPRPLALAEAGGQRLELVLAGSLERALEPFQALQRWLLAITAAAVLIFALLSYAMARFVTRPLGSLVRAAEQLGRGDYDEALAGLNRRDEFGELAGAFERMRQGIRGEMLFDQRLTQLPNRLQFRQALQARLAERRPLAVLLLGVNRFKNVNELLGFEAGDRLLQALAQRLVQGVRPGDLVARLGGDVFALLLPGADAADAQVAAARLAQALEQPMALDDKQVDLHAAIGIACAPLHGDDAERLLARAEAAMGAAKERTLALLLYDPAFDTASAQTLSLLSELRLALERDELRLFLQPKVALAGPRRGEVVGAEALLRWQHPARGLVPPVQFIPYAEQTGFIRQLTLWIFERVLAEQAALAALGLDHLSVNLSARDLIDQDLPAKLEERLARHGGRPEGLCLEITESAIMADPARAQATLARLRARGFRLSIDDFGAGQTSLTYLKDLRVDELKIDMVFVRSMLDEPKNASIVQSLVGLGHALGLEVVAEGVESAAIAERLAAMGCDVAQGYAYGRPMPVAEMAAWLRRFRSRDEAVAATA